MSDCRFRRYDEGVDGLDFNDGNPGFWETSAVDTGLTERSSIISPDNNMITNILSSQVQNTINLRDVSNKPECEPKPVRNKEHKLPFTAPWVIRRIKEDQTENALTQLRIWMPERRREEADEEMINRIRQLSDKDALIALKSLRKPRMFIRGSKGMQLDVTAILQTVDTLETFKVKGLIDSGYT